MLFCLRLFCRTGAKAVPDLSADGADPDEEADKGRDQPADPQRGQRELHHPLGQAAQRDARLLASVKDGKAQREGHAEGIDLGAAAPETIEVGEDDQHRHQRIEHHQHRKDGINEGVQAHIGDKPGKQDDDGDDFAVGPVGEHLGKVVAEGGGQTDRGGQAGQHDGDAQNQVAPAPKQRIDRVVEDYAAVGEGRHSRRLRTHKAQSSIDQTEQRHRDDTDDDGVVYHLFVLGDPLVLEGIDHDDGKNQRCEAIQRKVALQQALDEWAVLVNNRGLLDWAQGIEPGRDKNNENREKQQRGHKLADDVDDLRGLEREKVGERKKDRCVHQHRHKLGAALLQKGDNTDLKGDRPGTRQRKQRTKQQIDCRRQNKSNLFSGLSDQAVHAVSGDHHRDDAQHCKPRIGDDESQQRCGRLGARLLTQQGRKDHVAGSKKDGEQHEGRIDYLGDCQFLFHLDSRSSQKVFCVYLSIFYAICQESHLKFCIF